MVTVTDREIPARQCTKTALPLSLASSKSDKRLRLSIQFKRAVRSMLYYSYIVHRSE